MSVLTSPVPLHLTQTSAFRVGVLQVQPGFTDLSTGTPSVTSWFWDFGDGGTSSAPNPTHNYTTAGTYSVLLLVGNGAAVDSIRKNIIISDPPSITVSPTNICPGGSVTLFPITTASGAATYVWSPATDLSSATTKAPKCTTPVTRTYTVTVTDTTGCQASTTVRVTVLTAPSISAVPLGSATICEGDSVRLSGTGGTSYTWSPGHLVSDSTDPAPLYQMYNNHIVHRDGFRRNVYKHRYFNDHGGTRASSRYHFSHR